MRKSMLLHRGVGLFLLCSSSFASAASITGKTDTLPVQHVHDGIANEWLPGQFSTDEETSIRYAIDNDANDLYIALIIPNTSTQIKMMRLGMNLFFDLKGKKKEGRGIGFPVKPEGETAGGGGFGGGGFGGRGSGQETNDDADRGDAAATGQTRERKGPDMKRMRMMMATHLMSMHLFGFGEGDPVDQGLERESSAQIAFSWDSSDVWHIEYKIPLTLFGDPSGLDQHLISVGFKLNGVEQPASPTGGSGGGFGGGRGGGGGFGGRGGPGGRGGGGGASQVDFQKMMKEQSFWTKYTFVINPPAQKAF